MPLQHFIFIIQEFITCLVTVYFCYISSTLQIGPTRNTSVDPWAACTETIDMKPSSWVSVPGYDYINGSGQAIEPGECILLLLARLPIVRGHLHSGSSTVKGAKNVYWLKNGDGW